MRAFNTNDGLAHNRINCIVQAPNGLLWFCTDDGLTRYDGQKMVTYRREDGLPHAHVNSLLYRRNGEMWLATDGGLARMEPRRNSTRLLFTVYRLPELPESNNVNHIAEDSEGNLWCATSGGLFRLDGKDGRFHTVDLPGFAMGRDARHVTKVLIGADGAIWIGTVKGGVLRREGHNPWRQFGVGQGLPDAFAGGIEPAGNNTIWVALRHAGALRLRSIPQHPWFRIEERINEPVKGRAVFDIFRSRDGRLMFSGAGFVVGRESPNAFVTERRYGTEDGLTDSEIRCLGEDGEGNLWVGTYDSGLVRIPREGFTTYNNADGFIKGFQTILSGPLGEPCFWSGTQLNRTLACFDGKRFVPLLLNLPPNVPALGLESRQAITTDLYNGWWFTTQDVLIRLTAPSLRDLATARVDRFPTRAFSGTPYHVFTDSQGDIWMGGRGALLRWVRRTGEVQRWAPSDLAVKEVIIAAIAEPSPGVVWMGQRYQSPNLRWRNSRIEVLQRGEGTPTGMVNAFHTDHKGKLWIATGGNGIYRVENPSADQPRYRNYTAADGLSSNDVYAITEDRLGRLYLGTGNGVVRMSGDPPRFLHFTEEHGLAPGLIQDAFCDRNGDIWIATKEGASRISPLADPHAQPPQTVVTSVRVNGLARPSDELGEQRIVDLHLGPRENNLEIGFGAVDQRVGARLDFQTRLRHDQLWSDWAGDRSVRYADLSPGSYQFEVRARNEFGQQSSQPATIVFSIASPLWQRWWFLWAVSCIVAGLGLWAHQFRLSRAVALERMRARISADLHDDFGASLSRIVLLSELANQRFSSAPSESRSVIAEIADTGRSLLDNMSDIVWSIDPRCDNLQDLTDRIREFAGAHLEPQNITWTMDALPAIADGALTPERRRDVYLIFKEAIHNIGKHAGPCHVHLRLHLSDGFLLGEIQDDGKGIGAISNDGNGLSNMDSRARRCGGKLEIRSQPGKGTTLRFSVPATSSPGA